jgi:hypothetical protein
MLQTWLPRPGGKKHGVYDSPAVYRINRVYYNYIMAVWRTRLAQIIQEGYR